VDSATPSVKAVNVELHDLSTGEGISERLTALAVSLSIAELRRDHRTVGQGEVHVRVEERA
jgi:hypothetical protein